MTDAPSSWLLPDWPAPSRVRAVVTMREGPEREGSDQASRSPYAFNLGARCGDDPAAVARNRACLCDALSLSSEPCWLHQVHGTAVVVFTGEQLSMVLGACPAVPGRALAGAECDSTHSVKASGSPQADAAVTRAPGRVLAILTADCLPVLLCADDGSEIAAAHAGWRGLAAGVLENALAAMQTPREKILAWLGPAIAAQSYEVGDEVRAAFLARDAAAASAFTLTRPGHWHCDLHALARQRLRAAGIARVFGGGFDTFADQRLHSYRRDGARSGRMASLIWLAP